MVHPILLVFLNNSSFVKGRSVIYSSINAVIFNPWSYLTSPSSFDGWIGGELMFLKALHAHEA